MKNIIRTAIFSSCLLLIACSDGADRVEAKNPLEDQLKAMQKAKEVEKTLQESFERQNRAIDQQSQ